MIRSFAWAALLFLRLALADHAEGQTADHAAEWEARHAAYMDQPGIIKTPSALRITTNSPRPLDQIVGVLGGRSGWHINYEDPHYAEIDLVDSTAPRWLLQHPNGRRVHMVAGHAFDVTVPLSASSENPSRITEQVLAAVVKVYNDSGNPGRFELRILNGGTFDIVPIAASDGKQKPILDTVMSFEAKDTDSADVTLRRFCAELGSQSREPVEFWGFGGLASNRLMQETIELEAKDQPAREILRQMLREIGRTLTWRVLYESDLRTFTLELR